MAELRNQQPPPDGPWTVGRHAVPMPPALSTRPPTADSQAAPQPDRSEDVRPPDSNLEMNEAQNIALEPLASTVAETGNIQLAADGDDNSDARTGEWMVDPTARSIPVQVQTAPRSTRFRIVLLLLLLAILSAVAFWSPERLQTVAASTMELLLSTDIPEARRAPGPGPLVGQLDASSTPSGIELFVDDERHGVTPAQLVLNAGIHEVTLVSPVGTVRRKVRVRPGHRTLFSEAIFNGSLVISSAIEVEVRIDGNVVGVSAGHVLVLAPGSYQLELLSPNDGAHTVHTVEILLGQVTTLDAAAPLGNDS